MSLDTHCNSNALFAAELSIFHQGTEVYFCVSNQERLTNIHTGGCFTYMNTITSIKHPFETIEVLPLQKLDIWSAANAECCGELSSFSITALLQSIVIKLCRILLCLN